MAHQLLSSQMGLVETVETEVGQLADLTAIV